MKQMQAHEKTLNETHQKNPGTWEDTPGTWEDTADEKKTRHMGRHGGNMRRHGGNMRRHGSVMGPEMLIFTMKNECTGSARRIGHERITVLARLPLWRFWTTLLNPL